MRNGTLSSLRILSKLDIAVDFKPSHTLRPKLAHLKNKASKHKLTNTVHAVQCTDECLDLYTGENSLFQTYATI